MTMPKSLRPRYRYLFCSLDAEKSIDKEGLRSAIWRDARGLIGDVGSAESDIKLVEVKRDIAVVRCRRGEVDRARAVVACLGSSSDMDIGAWVIGVSGTIKSGLRKIENGDWSVYGER